VDTPILDQTPDVSLDNALSLRDAAAAAGVTEKTIRRWIKGGRLHAIKLGGQYRITVADLEHSRSAGPGGHDQGPLPDTGQPLGSTRVDARPDTAPAHPGVDLRPVMDHIARLEGEVRQLAEAATVWQVRAVQAEEKLKALGAGDAPTEEPSPAPPPDRDGETRPATAALMPRWRRWLRRTVDG